MVAEAEVEQHDDLGEQNRVVLKRYREARDYGFTRLEARLFAEADGDIGQLRRLRELGCPPEVAAQILI